MNPDNATVYNEVFKDVGGWADPQYFPPEHSLFLEKVRKRIVPPLERANRAIEKELNYKSSFRFDYINNQFVNAFALQSHPYRLIGITSQAAIRIRNVITGNLECRRLALSWRGRFVVWWGDSWFSERLGIRVPGWFIPQFVFLNDRRPRRFGDNVAMMAVEFIALHEVAHLAYEHCSYLGSLGNGPRKTEWGPVLGPVHIVRGLEVDADIRACEMAASMCAANTNRGVLNFFWDLSTGITTLFSLFEFLGIWTPSLGPQYHPSPEARIVIAWHAIEEYAKTRYPKLSEQISSTTFDAMQRIVMQYQRLGIGHRRIIEKSPDLRDEIQQSFEERNASLKLLDQFVQSVNMKLQ